MSVQLIIADYSEKSFVVFGEDTKKYKEDFKSRGGLWNKNLTLNNTSIKGWIFSHKKRADIENFFEGLRKPPFADIVPPTADIPKIAALMCDKATQTDLEDKSDQDEYDRITNNWLSENLAKMPNLPEKKVVITKAAPKLDNTYFLCECGVRVLRKNKFRHLTCASHKQIIKLKEGVTSDKLD
jgi:hypothetical protein